MKEKGKWVYYRTERFNFSHMAMFPVLFYVLHPVIFVKSLWCAVFGHKMKGFEREGWSVTHFTCECCGAEADLEDDPDYAG